MERIIITASNQVGVIADMTTVLADAGINIATIDAEGAGDTGIVILTTPENDRALDVLRSAGFKAVNRRRARHQAARRTGRPRKSGGEAQAGGGEHTEPPHTRPPRRLYDRRPIP